MYIYSSFFPTFFPIISTVLVIIVLVILRLVLTSAVLVNPTDNPTDNPTVNKANQSVLQLNEINLQLSTIITSKQTQVDLLNIDINNLRATRDNLQGILELAINTASTQIVIPAEVVPDPEIVLLVNLRRDILTYMDANFVPTTIYPKTSTFYTDIDSMISTYLTTTSLTLSQFLTTYTESRTIAFRQAIQEIHDTTTFYIFDTFYTQLSAA